MAGNALLKRWVLEALSALGGSGKDVEGSRHIWEHHQADLKAEGDRFYAWQYAMRLGGTNPAERGQAEQGRQKPNLVSRKKN